MSDTLLFLHIFVFLLINKAFLGLWLNCAWDDVRGSENVVPFGVWWLIHICISHHLMTHCAGETCMCEPATCMTVNKITIRKLDIATYIFQSPSGNTIHQ